MRNKNSERQEDHFNRLPVDLVLYILTILADLKSLFLCSLVSKRFASLIPQVRAITIELPNNIEMPSIESCNRTRTIFYELQSYTTEQISAFLQELKLPVFLEKFREVESIHMEYKYQSEFDDASLIKWKAKHGRDGRSIEKFVAILPASVYRITEYQEQVSQESSTSVSVRDMSCLSCFLTMSFAHYIEWLCVICMLIKYHASLRTVTVTDFEKRGKLVLKDEQLVEMRSWLHERKTQEYRLSPVVKSALGNVLELPLSKLVMKDVCLMMVKFGTDEDDDDDVSGWDFAEDEKALGEAVKLIFGSTQNSQFFYC